MSKTASQKLLRDLNQRIGQLEHEKSLMAEYNGRLEQQLAELPDKLFNLLDRLSTELAELRERIQQLEAKQALINHFHRGG